MIFLTRGSFLILPVYSESSKRCPGVRSQGGAQHVKCEAHNSYEEVVVVHKKDETHEERALVEALPRANTSSWASNALVGEHKRVYGTLLGGVQVVVYGVQHVWFPLGELLRVRLQWCWCPGISRCNLLHQFHILVRLLRHKLLPYLLLVSVFFKIILILKC